MQRIGVLAAALALAACGGGGEGSTTQQVGGDSGTELAAEQVLHLGNGTEIQSLDPHRGEEVSGSNVQRDVYEGLISEAPNGDLIPGVAESWTISPDGKTYVFNLRHDARWSNADPVTANDFAFALRRGVDPATLSTYSYILSPIVNADDIAAGHKPPSELGVRVLDDYTLEITLANPTAYFLGLLTHSMGYPVHRASLEAYGDQFTRPGKLVGNGAFTLAEWVVQSHIKLVRNPNYWDNKNNKIDEIWFYPTEDQNAELQRYRAAARESGQRAVDHALPRQLLLRVQRDAAAVQGSGEAAPSVVARGRSHDHRGADHRRGPNSGIRLRAASCELQGPEDDRGFVDAGRARG